MGAPYLNFEELTMFTSVFRSGNLLSMHIPDELEFGAEGQEIDVERVGNTLVVRILPTKILAGLSDIFTSFSPNFMTHSRQVEDEHERD
jgi:antitoxin VapB